MKNTIQLNSKSMFSGQKSSSKVPYKSKNKTHNTKITLGHTVTLVLWTKESLSMIWTLVECSLDQSAEAAIFIFFREGVTTRVICICVCNHQPLFTDNIVKCFLLSEQITCEFVTVTSPRCFDALTAQTTKCCLLSRVSIQFPFARVHLDPTGFLYSPYGVFAHYT